MELNKIRETIAPTFGIAIPWGQVGGKISHFIIGFNLIIKYLSDMSFIRIWVHLIWSTKKQTKNY